MNTLYHYTSLSKCIIDILPHKRLLMNQIRNSNDPYESQLFNFEIKNKPSDIEDPFFFFGLHSRTNEKVRLNTRMVCFSIQRSINKKKIEGYNLPRMWAQYGENHQGVCLIIKKDEFIKENKSLFDFKNQVHYSQELKAPSVDYDKLKGISSQDKQIIKIIYELKKEIFFSKMVDWKTENEFRFINISRPEFEYCSIENSLFGLILGCRFEIVYLPSILEQIRSYNHDIKLFKAYFQNKIRIADYIMDGFQYS